MTAADKVSLKLSREVRRIARQLNGLRRDVDSIARASQARYRSIEAGSITVYDEDGSVRTALGQQPDGTYTVTDLNATPPPVPSAPIVSIGHNSVTVAWDGRTADGSAWPADWDRVELHMGDVPGEPATNDNELASFHSVNGGTISLALPAGVPHYFMFTAVNTSGAESAATVEVEAIPLEIREAVNDSALTGVTITNGQVTLEEDRIRIIPSGAQGGSIQLDASGYGPNQNASIEFTAATGETGANAFRSAAIYQTSDGYLHLDGVLIIDSPQGLAMTRDVGGGAERSGWNIVLENVVRHGQFVQFYFVLERTGGTITVPANGNITNVAVLRFPVGFRPAYSVGAGSGGVGRVASYVITDDGWMRLSAVAGTGDVTNGDSLSAGGFFVVDW